MSLNASAGEGRSDKIMLALCGAECAAYWTAADRRVKDRRVSDRRVSNGA